MSPTNALPEGAPYSTLERMTPPALALISLIAIGHAVSPEEFGAATLALAIVRLLRLPIERLFHDALVQHKELDASHVSAAFTLTFALAVALCAGCQWLGRVLTATWQQPLLGNLLSFMSLSLLGTGASRVLASLVRRRGELRTLGLCSLGSAIGSTAIALAVLVQGGGVYSLVVQEVSMAWLGTLIIWLLPHERPRVRLQVRSARELTRFRAPLHTPVKFVELAGYGSLLLAGAWLGNRGAGLFGLALRSSEALRQLFGRAKPASGGAATPRRLRATLIPTCVFLALAAGSELIALAFGAQWSDVGNYFRVIALLYAVIPLVIARGIPRDERG